MAARVVLSGSLSFYGEMQRLQSELALHGFNSVIPASPDVPSGATAEMISDIRRVEAFRHIQRIKDPRTRALLVFNQSKHGRESYIGPSTFAEVGISFAQSKPILLFFGIPEIFGEELREWRARCSHGSFDECLLHLGELLPSVHAHQLNLPFADNNDGL